MPFIDNKVVQGVFTPEEKRELVERVSETVIAPECEALPPSPTSQSPKPEAGNGRSGDRLPQPAGEAQPVHLSLGVVPDLPVPIVLAAISPPHEPGRAQGHVPGIPPRLTEEVAVTPGRCSWSIRVKSALTVPLVH
jgi:hypothetical protein